RPTAALPLVVRRQNRLPLDQRCFPHRQPLRLFGARSALLERLWRECQHLARLPARCQLRRNVLPEARRGQAQTVAEADEGIQRRRALMLFAHENMKKRIAWPRLFLDGSSGQDACAVLVKQLVVNAEIQLFAEREDRPAAAAQVRLDPVHLRRREAGHAAKEHAIALAQVAQAGIAEFLTAQHLRLVRRGHSGAVPAVRSGGLRSDGLSASPGRAVPRAKPSTAVSPLTSVPTPLPLTATTKPRPPSTAQAPGFTRPGARQAPGDLDACAN